jgi:GxxExxY protein
MRAFAEHHLTEIIIGRAIEIHRTLGPGLLEKTYEECLAYELREHGVVVEQQKHLPLAYDRLLLTDAYRVDLLINNSVIVELKTVEALTELHLAQVRTYLRCTNLNVGLLINFNSLILRDGLKRVFNKKKQFSGVSVPQQSPEIISP